MAYSGPLLYWIDETLETLLSLLKHTIDNKSETHLNLSSYWESSLEMFWWARDDGPPDGFL